MNSVISVVYMYAVLDENLKLLGVSMASDLIQANIFWNKMYPNSDVCISVPMNQYRSR